MMSAYWWNALEGSWSVMSSCPLEDWWWLFRICYPVFLLCECNTFNTTTCFMWFMLWILPFVFFTSHVILIVSDWTGGACRSWLPLFSCIKCYLFSYYLGILCSCKRLVHCCGGFPGDYYEFGVCDFHNSSLIFHLRTFII